MKEMVDPLCTEIYWLLYEVSLLYHVCHYYDHALRVNDHDHDNYYALCALNEDFNVLDNVLKIHANDDLLSLYDL